MAPRAFPNVPNPVWFILSIPVAALLVVLVVAFFWTWSRADCRQSFLAWQVGPDKDCPEYEKYPMEPEQAAALAEWSKRKWCDMSSVRHKNRQYRNEHAFPIEIAVTTQSGVSTTNFCVLRIAVDGRLLVFQENLYQENSKRCAATATVPPGSTYEVQADWSIEGRVSTWHELSLCDSGSSGDP